jgi:hypothetical protein
MIDIKVLEECVRRADAVGFSTRQLVWSEAARIYTARVGRVSPSTVRRLSGIHLMTPLGARGGNHGGRRGRRATNGGSSELKVPTGYRRLAERAAAGSRAAGVKLKCLECCNWEKGEVRKCEDKSCPLWQFRPYQGKAQVLLVN